MMRTTTDLDLTALLDEELEDLAVRVLAEQDRRDTIAATGRQVAEANRTYHAGRVHRADGMTAECEPGAPGSKGWTDITEEAGE